MNYFGNLSLQLHCVIVLTVLFFGFTNKWKRSCENFKALDILLSVCFTHVHSDETRNSQINSWSWRG